MYSFRFPQRVRRCEHPALGDMPFILGSLICQVSLHVVMEAVLNAGPKLCNRSRPCVYMHIWSSESWLGTGISMKNSGAGPELHGRTAGLGALRLQIHGAHGPCRASIRLLGVYLWVCEACVALIPQQAAFAPK